MKSVLFLCPHGGAKSVIAASHFDRLAAARGLPFVAIAAAAAAPYETVPKPVADFLQSDGVDIRRFEPRRVNPRDLRNASRVVSIDCDPIAIEALDALGNRIERWDDVPRVDVDLPGSVAAIRTHVERLVDQLQSDSEPEPWPEFLHAMSRIAANSFGGPVAQIAVVHEEIVERRKWIDDPTFARLLSFANVLPGPEALELVVHVGYLRRGWTGGIVAGLLFIAPGVVSLTLLAWLYTRYGAEPAFLGIPGAIRPVAVSLVVAAALRLSRKLLPAVPGYAIAAASLIASRFLAAPVVLVLVSAALLGIALPHARPLAPPRRIFFAAALVAVAIAIGAAMPRSAPGASSGIAPHRGRASLPEIAALNLKTALVTFGGAYAALPYIREQVVDRRGWLSDGEMLDALALGETTPGPLISIGVFVSYVAGGLPAALVGAIFLFLPSFVLVLGLARFADRILSEPTVVRALEGVVAGTIGLILALTSGLVGGIRSADPALIAATAFVVAWFGRISPALVVLAAVIGAAAAHALL